MSEADLVHGKTSDAIGNGKSPVAICDEKLEAKHLDKRRRSERIKSLVVSTVKKPAEEEAGDEKKSEDEKKVETIDLSPLLTMPLDVFQEVLGHLHPQDLIFASRVSRRFREHILSKNSGVWRRSRERVGAPDCPSDFSEPAWAALLFVPRCQMCGASDVHVVDFFIQRRLCQPCRAKSLMRRVSFETAYPKHSDEILDLVPYTDTRVTFRTKLKDIAPRFYMKQEIEQVASRIAVYSRFPAPVSGGRTKLDIFKEYRRAKIRAMHRAAPSSQSWLHDQFLKQHIDENVLSL